MAIDWIEAPQEEPKKYPNSFIYGEEKPINLLTWIKLGYIIDIDENLVYLVPIEDLFRRS